MNELGLGYNVIVVGQDLGGIVGMSVVKDGPEKFSGLVLINSGLPNLSFWRQKGRRSSSK